jgi:hypothetical protein
MARINSTLGVLVNNTAQSAAKVTLDDKLDDFE